MKNDTQKTMFEKTDLLVHPCELLESNKKKVLEDGGKTQKGGEVGMTRLEYLKFIDKNCPYSKNGKCELCNELSVQCDGERFIHCYEFEHSEIGKEVKVE